MHSIIQQPPLRCCDQIKEHNWKMQESLLDVCVMLKCVRGSQRTGRKSEGVWPAARSSEEQQSAAAPIPHVLPIGFCTGEGERERDGGGGGFPGRPWKSTLYNSLLPSRQIKGPLLKAGWGGSRGLGQQKEALLKSKTTSGLPKNCWCFSSWQRRKVLYFIQKKMVYMFVLISS